MPLLLEDGAAGLLVPWGDPPALGEALGRLRARPEWAAGLGARGRQAMRAFAQARERRAWRALYREILEC